jgi:flavin-dependent dehydrogenase
VTPAGGVPQGDHLNIGVYGWRRTGPSLRARLERLTRAYGFDPAELRGLRGHHLPVRPSGSPLVDGNVLLVGDAAGLLDPFTGEGICAAIWSGRAAAGAIADHLGGEAPDLRGYLQACTRHLLSDIEVAHQMRQAFHLAPAAAMTLMRWSPGSWRLLCDLVRGDRTSASFKRESRSLRLGFDVVAELTRWPRWRQAAGDDLEPPLAPPGAGAAPRMVR